MRGILGVIDRRLLAARHHRHLVKDLGQEVNGAIALAELEVLGVVEHLVELGAGLVGDGVESLEAAKLADQGLHLAQRGLGLEVLAALRTRRERNAVDTHVHVHVALC